MLLSTHSETAADAEASSRLPEATSREDDADAALARLARAGNMTAYGQLVTRHEKRITALVGRILGGRVSADDVADTVQDIFVQVWRALPKYRGDARFSTWLYRIATNMAIREWHRTKRRRLFVAEEDLPEQTRLSIADTAPSPAEAAETKDRKRALQTAIERLPEKQRTVLLLHYYEDYSCEEIAQMIGCSVGTVWSRLHYGCRKLRTTLDWPQAL